MQRALRSTIALLVLAGAACAGAPAKGNKVRWPPEPDPARIRFVRSITSGADLETSAWPGVQRALLGTSPITFRQPTSLAISNDGRRLYMTDQSLGQVVKFDFGKGAAERVSDFGFMQPFGVAVDQDENVYVSEPPARRVRAFSPTGQLLREFGGEAERPTGLAIDQKRQLVYVADGSFPNSQNHRVLVYSTQGKLLRTIGGRGSALGQFNFPAYLALDKAGNLFVIDVLNFRVQAFDPEGNLFRSFGEGGEGLGKFVRPKGIAIDKRNIAYIVDGEMAIVQMFDDQSRLLMAFGGKANMLEYFDMPAPIAIDPEGKLIYVGETSNLLPRINVYEFVEVAETGSQPPGTAPAVPVQVPAATPSPGAMK